MSELTATGNVAGRRSSCPLGTQPACGAALGTEAMRASASTQTSTYAMAIKLTDGIPTGLRIRCVHPCVRRTRRPWARGARSGKAGYPGPGASIYAEPRRRHGALLDAARAATPIRSLAGATRAHFVRAFRNPWLFIRSIPGPAGAFPIITNHALARLCAPPQGRARALSMRQHQCLASISKVGLRPASRSAIRHVQADFHSTALSARRSSVANANQPSQARTMPSPREDSGIRCKRWLGLGRRSYQNTPTGPISATSTGAAMTRSRAASSLLCRRPRSAHRAREYFSSRSVQNLFDGRAPTTSSRPTPCFQPVGGMD